MNMGVARSQSTLEPHNFLDHMLPYKVELVFLPTLMRRVSFKINTVGALSLARGPGYGITYHKRRKIRTPLHFFKSPAKGRLPPIALACGFAPLS